jgi:tetratricopeptide (TPR) repeat protein
MKVKLAEKKQKYIAEKGKYQTEIDAMKEDLRPTFNAMEAYLQIGIRLMDMKMVLEALEMFKKLNRHPKNSTLKFLGNLKNLPV